MAPSIKFTLKSDLLVMSVLFLLLLASLFGLAGSHNNIERFGDFYIWLLGLNAVGLLFILTKVTALTWDLIRQLRKQVAGTRLTLKVLIMFIVISLLPVSIVYAFSQNFLRSAIDSWFDIPVETALEDSLELSRNAINVQMRTLQRITTNLSKSFYDIQPHAAVILLDELRQEWDLLELTLLTTGNEVIASSTADNINIRPSHASDGDILQVRSGGSSIDFKINDESGAHFIAVVPVLPFSALTQNRMLLAIFPYSNRIGTLSENVQAAFSGYRKLEFLRNSLKWTYFLTLTLVLLFSTLMSVWLAFYLSRRLIFPIQNLAKGTRSVAKGDFSTRLPTSGRDELSFLVDSFNQMTQRLSTAQTKSQSDQTLIENQRAYLSTVLEHISSGVIALDGDQIIRTVNITAGEILQIDAFSLQGKCLSDYSEDNPLIDQFNTVITPLLEQPKIEWQEEFEISGDQGKRKIINCRGAQLADQKASQPGWVLVFEDATGIVTAQREAAWGEVARRLAHEIKNPLTPIQLSAERLRHKLLDDLPPEAAKILDRSTHTIVQQVEAMKAMVNAFAEYAATPVSTYKPLSINQVIREVADLYSGMKESIKITLYLDGQLPQVSADAARIRQLLHNVIKNALESRKSSGTGVTVTITTELMLGRNQMRQVLITIQDDGPGFPEDLMNKLFEPYVTSKSKGSGLGLAIVKKITEEHDGTIHVSNQDGGAQLSIQIPCINQPDASTEGRPA